MFEHELTLLISGIATSEYMIMLFVFTAVTIITVWFAEGRLNSFLDVTFSILKYVILAKLTKYFNYIAKVSDVIDSNVTKPIHDAITRIPTYAKTIIYLLLGISIILLDHQYGKALFTTDETIPFYNINFQNREYWISLYALAIGGFFLVLAMLRVTSALLSWLLNFFDRTIHLSFLLYR